MSLYFGIRKTIANKLRILCKSEEHSTDGRHRTTCAEKRWNSIEIVKTVLSAFIQLSQAYSHPDFDDRIGKLKSGNSNYRAVSCKIQQFFTCRSHLRDGAGPIAASS